MMMTTTNSRLSSVPQMRQGKDTLLTDGQAYHLTERKGEAREIKQPTTYVVARVGGSRGPSTASTPLKGAK